MRVRVCVCLCYVRESVSCAAVRAASSSQLKDTHECLKGPMRAAIVDGNSVEAH